MGLQAAQGLLACPVCGAVLLLSERAALCPAGHHFDAARQGYLNLLGGPEPANADTAAMLQARERVLGSGLFDRVADAVAGAISGAERILEVGSGTAYYLQRCVSARPDARGIALDVSKAAARMASRRDPRIAAVIADVWRRLPLLDGRLDAVVAVFAPRNIPEFARVLAPDGRLVVVTPAPDHLAGIRGRYGLLDIDPDKQERLLASTREFFNLTANTRLRMGPRHVGADVITDLIAMGPNAFHGPPAEVEAGEVVVDVLVQVFRPVP